MPVEEMKALPVVIPGIQGADSEIDSDWPANATQLDGATMRVGTQLVGKFNPDFHCFWRFDTEIPAGAIVKGWSLVLHSINGSATPGAVMQLNGGWVRPQAGAYKWQDSLGVHEWPLIGDAPLAQWSNGFGNDLTVFHPTPIYPAGGPAFTGLAKNTVTGPAIWSLAEGSLSLGGTAAMPITETTGVVDQLASYLAENESLRGALTPDFIPTMFCLYQPYLGDIDQLQDFASQNNTFGGLRPEMYVDWELPPDPEGEIESSGQLSSTIASTGQISQAVSADGRLTSAVKSTGGASPAIASDGYIRSSINTRGALE